MLRQEEMRAVKKIDQTKKKTADFLRLQARNDMSFRRKQEEEMQKRHFNQHKQNTTVERHQKAMRDVRVRSNEVHQQKMVTVHEFRQQKN